MQHTPQFVAGIVFATMLSLPACAAPGGALGAAERSAVVQTVTTKMKANYIDPAVAERVAGAIARKNAQGGYSAATDMQAFGAALAKDLRTLSGDLHFDVRLDERFREDDSTGEYVPTQAEMDEARARIERAGFGIEKLERLPGNVGYIDVRSFRLPTFAGPAYTAAMSLMAGTDALILDLRRNGGGSPESVAYLMSHFFPLGVQRHLLDIYNRPENTTQQVWTDPTVARRYDKPVYVLISARTASAGEDCAYDFQTQKRGTLVGETTAGAANPVSPFSAGHGMVIFIPTARVTNTVTKTNWEHVGVRPDVAVPAAQALQTAHVAILRTLVASAQDEDARAQLRAALAMAEKGETPQPVYTPRAGR